MNDEASWPGHRDELYERVVRRGRFLQWRRRGFAAGSVVLALALSAAAYGATRPSNETRVVTPPPEQTTMTAPTARPAHVFLLGDSVMLGARAALEQAIPGAVIDAVVSRQYGNAPAVLAAAKQTGALPSVVVIDLGTNGAIPDRTLGEIMQTVGPGTAVYFLTAHVPRVWESEVNNTLRDFTATTPNTHLLDWHDFAQGHDDWFVSDGFHLTVVGQQAYANFIREGLG